MCSGICIKIACIDYLVQAFKVDSRVAFAHGQIKTNKSNWPFNLAVNFYVIVFIF